MKAAELFQALADALASGEAEQVHAITAPIIRLGGIDGVAIQEFSETAPKLASAFSGLRVDVIHCECDGDVAWGRLQVRGRNDGPWQGREPTGREIDYSILTGIVAEDGLIVALDLQTDGVEIRKQLGLIEARQWGAPPG
jgi:predicted ester cyclase